MSDDARDSGFDDFFDALTEGNPYYLKSPSGNAYLPPRSVDPETGETELSREPLPETGEVITQTVTYVAGPRFEDNAPFAVVIAEFGQLRITGQMRDVDPESVEIGDEVELGVEESETSGERVPVFYPA
jgi:uncharacterized OB-fold protein